jgi:hypothetical protein
MHIGHYFEMFAIAGVFAIILPKPHSHVVILLF